MDVGRFCSMYVMVIQQQAVRQSETKGETDNAIWKCWAFKTAHKCGFCVTHTEVKTTVVLIEGEKRAWLEVTRVHLAERACFS